jgi:replication factor C subunit 3/5
MYTPFHNNATPLSDDPPSSIRNDQGYNKPKEPQQKNIPWVEKYRPTKFDNIVLDSVNRKLFENILEKKYFPNLLFYGPPGTGKTTTIINLINEFQNKYSSHHKGSVIHLNASDERGIDIIRNQINQFVKSSSLFDNGLKFVILDEVDYMTKNAQHALKYLLQTFTYNVRFCLICNYISKIDESLQNEFICIRFNQLPKKDIDQFIRSICEKENIQLSEGMINIIQSNYHSDIRSMINFIQLNQNLTEWEKNVADCSVWENIHRQLQDPMIEENDLISLIHEISIKYNIDKKNIIQTYFNYVIRNDPTRITPGFLSIIETLVHHQEIKIEYIIYTFIRSLRKLYHA